MYVEGVMLPLASRKAVICNVPGFLYCKDSRIMHCINKHTYTSIYTYIITWYLALYICQLK